jgi:hypothetical protein
MRVFFYDELLEVENLIGQAIARLIKNDSLLIRSEKKIAGMEKFVEICVNHRLALYLEECLTEKGICCIVDVVYDTNNEKNTNACEYESPTIIVSTQERECDEARRNYLAVEAKKGDEFFQSARGVQCFLKGERAYQFGAKIAYGSPRTRENFLLFYRADGGEIKTKYSRAS